MTIATATRIALRRRRTRLLAPLLLVLCPAAAGCVDEFGVGSLEPARLFTVGLTSAPPAVAGTAVATPRLPRAGEDAAEAERPAEAPKTVPATTPTITPSPVPSADTSEASDPAPGSSIVVPVAPATPRVIPPNTSPRDVLAIQPRSMTEQMEVLDRRERPVVVTLNNIAPAAGIWYVLHFDGEGHVGRGFLGSSYHLEVVDRVWALHLDPGFERGLILKAGDDRIECPLWKHPKRALSRALERNAAYMLLCDGKVLLRRAKRGHRSSREWVAEFLRDRVPGGEKLTRVTKEVFLKDEHLQRADSVSVAGADSGHAPGAPGAPHVSATMAGRAFEPEGLGLDPVVEDGAGRLVLGRWYALEEQPGAFLSALEPRAVAEDVTRAQVGRVNTLDDVEERALTYMVAFDLDLYDLGYGLGTDHPRVGWSERARTQVVDERIPGPDGFGTLTPLVRTGRVSPARTPSVIATFTGGFKRRHGAFKSGQLSLTNGGSHYGFVEEGVVLSSPQPDLATAIVWNDARVELKTWTPEDTARLGEVRYARQNGVPLVDRDPVTGSPRPGDLVRSWGKGNWSGSQDKKFRTLRAGLCLQDGPGGRFLIYGYFSSVTASAMARVFQAYDCEYAMMLDMNALEHTYMAVYTTKGGKPVVHHLQRGMDVLDKVDEDGAVLPRFLAYPDNRDFFYLTKKGG